MKFNELRIGAIFEFEPIDKRFIDCCKQGPWVKTSARMYVMSTDPFSLKADERRRHERNIDLRYEVGSINAEVVIV